MAGIIQTDRQTDSDNHSIYRAGKKRQKASRQDSMSWGGGEAITDPIWKCVK